MITCSFCVEAGTRVKCFKTKQIYAQDAINNHLRKLSIECKPVKNIQMVTLNDEYLQVLISYDSITD